MRILITGAAGNVGTGMSERLAAAGHELVLTDIAEPHVSVTHRFVRCDLLTGDGLDAASEGCDLVLHTAAWHGIHLSSKSPVDFWRLNVDGTFLVLEAARTAGIDRLVFLSSLAWHDRYGTYGFTKVVGEELCEQQRRTRGLRYVAVRPGDFTPWGDNFIRYGSRLLYGGVDRDDVLDCVALAVERLVADGGRSDEAEAIVVNAVRANAFREDELDGWERDPLAACERIFPGSAALVGRYAIDISRRPVVVDPGDAEQTIGYVPRTHFGTFLQQLAALDPQAVAEQRCPY